MRVDEFDYKLPKELISLKTLRERRDESPLLVLDRKTERVSAFTGLESIRKAYEHTINNAYRLYGFGDAMFIG